MKWTIINKALCAVVVCLAITLFVGCTGQDADSDIKAEEISISEAMDFDQLRTYYGENYGLSDNDAEGKLAQMGIAKEESTTYKVVTQRIEGAKVKPRVEFYLTSEKGEEDWGAKDIKALVSFDDDGAFLGGITCWLRENNTIEYSLEGDMFKAKDVEGNIFCRDTVSEDAIQRTYLSNDKVENEKGESVFIHKMIKY